MMTEDDVRAEVRSACEAGGGQKTFAKKIGVSLPYLNDFLNSRRGLGPSILKALRLKKVIRYEKACSASEERVKPRKW